MPAHVPLALVPPVLEFEPWPLCVPSVTNVEMINTSEDEDVDVHSVSQMSEIFHVAQLNQTRLPPGGRLNFSVVFLPRELGSVQGSVLIQTSAGGFFYALSAMGMPSPYGLQPINATNVPVYTPYIPPIELTNPHEHPLRIREVFTSENFLHLMLPPEGMRGDQPAPGLHNGVWMLQPAERKHVISLSFNVSEPGMYEGYVHVLTDYDTLILPVSISVSLSFIDAPEVLDFGVVTSAEASAMLPLTLLSNYPSVAIHEVSMLPVSPALRMRPGQGRAADGSNLLTNANLPPMVATEVVHLFLSGAVEGDFSGTVVVTTTAPDPSLQRIVVPWRGKVRHGSLNYTLVLATQLAARSKVTNAKPSALASRGEIVLAVGNRFQEAVRIEGAELEDEHYALTSLADGRVLRPGAVHEVAALRMSLSRERAYHAQLKLKTNVTELLITLPVYHLRLRFTAAVYPQSFEPPPPDTMGALNHGSVEDGGIDFGHVAVGAARRALLNLTNPNPVTLRVVAVEVSPSLKGLFRCAIQTIRDMKQKQLKGRGASVLPVTVESEDGDAVHAPPPSAPPSSSTRSTRSTRSTSPHRSITFSY